MALYRVQSNGKAPTGLQAGDEVVTGGGTYRILGVNADGSYDLSEVSTGTTSYYTDMDAFLAKEVNNRSEWYDITTAPFNW